MASSPTRATTTSPSVALGCGRPILEFFYSSFLFAKSACLLYNRAVQRIQAYGATEVTASTQENSLPATQIAAVDGELASLRLQEANEQEVQAHDDGTSLGQTAPCSAARSAGSPERKPWKKWS